MAVRSVSKLIDLAKAKVKKVLVSEVIPFAIDLEIASIGVFVYDVYPSPYRYKRRGESGGLADRDHFKVRALNGGLAYEIENITPGKNNKNINVAELVYGGDGYKGLKYDYPEESKRADSRYTYLRPRDFITPTVEALEKPLKTLVKTVLENQGVRIKG